MSDWCRAGTKAASAAASPAFTLDDGYRDNRDFTLPVLREFDAPATIYVASDFADGEGRLWWIALEEVIAKSDHARGDDRPVRAAPRCRRRRRPSRLRSTACMTGCAGCRGEHDLQREITRALCQIRRRPRRTVPRAVSMSWDELKALARRAAADDRRPHSLPLQSRQAERGRPATLEIDGEPHADRSRRSAATCAASCLSLW